MHKSPRFEPVPAGIQVSLYQQNLLQYIGCCHVQEIP